ncbi:helix-turn-helix transcriptional regulator [Rugamonas rubra]|uniref:Regulatory protein, luxR family n=1 Tax=Rugamonas rubra TaxID=758825 RepID=A0A1I4J313_9BURK|nr:response regulator transcription factor [Rugamonas rubra]SFL60593.1 regulatory protein, luxR family [Rugamonas rubra]
MLEHLKQEAASISSVEEFKDWTRNSIRQIFPHSTLGCGYGRIHAGGVAIDGIVAIDYPVAHLKNICNAAGGLDTPILRRWLATREPQLFEENAPWPDVPEQWLRNFREADMRNVAAHAVYDTERCIGTYHSFHRIPGQVGARHAELLREIVPLLHDTLCPLLSDLKASNQTDSMIDLLSRREREVLLLVGQGKLNLEIAELLFISEITVKHHLTKIFQRLGMNKRTQLVRLAIENETRMKNSYGLLVL